MLFLTSVFADLPSHADLVAADESTSALSVASVTTNSDILILIPPTFEQYTILSESSLSSVTEITKLLQNAFVSAISTEANTQTSQQLYSLELLNSSLDSLTVSEPLRELLKSYTQIFLEVFERQPPKSETLALAMIHALFLENLYGIQTLPEQNELIQSEVIQDHPLLLEIAGFRPLIQSRSPYNRLQLLERADQLEILLRQNPGIQGAVRAQILSALKSFAEGKDKTLELAQSWISHQRQNRENHQAEPRSGSQFISMPDLKLSLIPTDGDARVRLTGTVNWCGTTYGGGGSCWPHDWLGIFIAAKHSISGQESWYLFQVPLNSKIFPGAKVDIQTEPIFTKLKQHTSIQKGKYKVTALWGSNNFNLIYVPNFSVEWEGVNYIADGAKPPEGMTVSLDTLSVAQDGSNSPAKSDKIYLSTKIPVNLESRLSKTEKFTQNDQYEFEFLLEIDGKTQSLLKRRINASTFTGGDTIVVAMNLLPLEMKEFDGKDGKITSSLKRLDRSSKPVTITQLISFNPPLFVKVLGCDEPRSEVAPTDGILSDYYNVLNCNFEVIGDPDDIEFYIRISEEIRQLRNLNELEAVSFNRGALTLNTAEDREPLIDGITTPDPAKSSLKTRNKKFSFRFVSRPVYFGVGASDGEYPYKNPATPLVKFHILPETSPGMPFTTRPAIFTGSGGSKITSEIFPVHQPREIITSHQGVSNPLWFAKSVEQLLEHYKNVPYVNQVLRQLEIRYGIEKKVQRDIVDNPYVVKLRYAHLLGKDNIPEGAGAIFKPGDWYSNDVPGEIFVETFGAKVRRNTQYSGVMTGIPPDMSYKYGLLNILLHELRHAYQHALAHTNHAHNPDKDIFVPCRTLSTQFSIYGYGQCDRFKDGLTVKGIQKFQEIDHGFLIDPIKYQVGEQTVFLGCNLMPGN
ncbi:MAG: hypothetical protein H3C47_07915, partial [Candidatus Cloacimonetes bacterium]|nr:hypothetical protein [Candidatus Cloacimonadota bacterium]